MDDESDQWQEEEEIRGSVSGVLVYPEQEEGRLDHSCDWNTLVVVVVAGPDVFVVDAL